MSVHWKISLLDENSTQHGCCRKLPPRYDQQDNCQLLEYKVQLHLQNLSCCCKEDRGEKWYQQTYTNMIYQIKAVHKLKEKIIAQWKQTK